MGRVEIGLPRCTNPPVLDLILESSDLTCPRMARSEHDSLEPLLWATRNMRYELGMIDDEQYARKRRNTHSRAPLRIGSLIGERWHQTIERAAVPRGREQCHARRRHRLAKRVDDREPLRQCATGEQCQRDDREARSVP
jgi:hypothetical protein